MEELSNDTIIDAVTCTYHVASIGK